MRKAYNIESSMFICSLLLYLLFLQQNLFFFVGQLFKKKVLLTYCSIAYLKLSLCSFIKIETNLKFMNKKAIL
jgi:hypothetical protein